MFMLNALCSIARTKPCTLRCTSQIDLEAGTPALHLEAGTPALHLGGPCLKYVSPDLVYRLKCCMIFLESLPSNFL